MSSPRPRTTVSASSRPCNCCRCRLCIVQGQFGSLVCSCDNGEPRGGGGDATPAPFFFSKVMWALDAMHTVQKIEAWQTLGRLRFKGFWAEFCTNCVICGT